jgi:hypothetical protein
MPLSPARRRLPLTVALMGVSLGAWAQPQPQPQPPQAQQRQPQQQQRERPQPQRSDNAQRHRDQQLSESVRRAERNGQVLSAEQIQSDGRDVNRVKIIDSRGRVRVYWDDPSQQKKDRNGRQDSGNGRDQPPRTRSDDDGDPTL